MPNLDFLPVAILGAGPVGLAAAAHLIDRGIPVRVYEAGETVGASIRQWAHVRTFSPWRYSIDSAAKKLLAKTQWREPPSDVLPTGDDLYRLYLAPLAATPEMAAVIETGAKVTAITRDGMDKVTSRGRQARPFVLSVKNGSASPRRELARAVVDASGTWTHQNPLGGNGLPAHGERQLKARLAYGIPDVLGRDRAEYAGRKVLVVGAGYSAANALLDLVKLAGEEPATSVHWIVRGTSLARVYGGGEGDQLPARGALGAQLQKLVRAGQIALTTGFGVTAVHDMEGGGLVLVGATAAGSREVGPVDKIVVLTGQRPDLELTRELRVDLDPWLESVKALGPLIDPNLHSCGSVPPHGHRELGHPEPGFYTVGVKSYGRAPTFLLLTGYEQVRSVAAAIAGDMEAADDVQLVLPETGVCSTESTEADSGASGGGCCGGPAPGRADACCVKDAAAKDAGAEGCGCGSPSVKNEPARCCGVAA
jgi:thioredoxin reductase